jgi:hypothetical protein
VTGRIRSDYGKLVREKKKNKKKKKRKINLAQIDGTLMKWAMKDAN